MFSGWGICVRPKCVLLFRDGSFVFHGISKMSPFLLKAETCRLALTLKFDHCSNAIEIVDILRKCYSQFIRIIDANKCSIAPCQMKAFKLVVSRCFSASAFG